MPMGFMSLMGMFLNNSWTIIWSDCSRKRHADQGLTVKAKARQLTRLRCCISSKVKTASLNQRGKPRRNLLIAGSVQVSSRVPDLDFASNQPGEIGKPLALHCS